MQVAILCGGQGTRLREETQTIPKPMVEIGGRPILWHILKTYSHFGFHEFILCLGYKGDIIRDYFLNYADRAGDVTVDLGRGTVTKRGDRHDEANWSVTLAETGADTLTGGRLKRIEPYITGPTFMATYGDGVADIDLAQLTAFHRAHGRIATVTAARPAARFGRLDIAKDGLVASFAEKPNSGEGWVNGGYFVFQREVFDYLDGDDCILERTPLEQLAAGGNLYAYEHHGFWQPMDTVRDLTVLRDLWAGERPWARWEREPACASS